MLISVIVASLSNALALLLRPQEALIGISQFIVLPLQFLSSAIMDIELAPEWVQTVARYNPVDWAVVASREALSAATDWAAVWPRLGLLVARGRRDGVAGHPGVRQLPAVALTVRSPAGQLPRGAVRPVVAACGAARSRGAPGAGCRGGRRPAARGSSSSAGVSGIS